MVWANLGLVFAVAGAALAVILGGAGSSKGVGLAASAADGLMSETPEKFPSLLILSALPGTQGIYGFVGAFFAINKLGFLGGTIPNVTTEQGLHILLACLPVGINGLISGIWQGKVSAAGVQVVAKHPGEFMKSVILSALVETYAILGLLASILLLMAVKVG